MKEQIGEPINQGQGQRSLKEVTRTKASLMQQDPRAVELTGSLKEQMVVKESTPGNGKSSKERTEEGRHLVLTH